MLGELEELDEGADDGELDELEWPPEGDVDEGEVGDELELLELLLARGGVAEFVVLEELLDDALFPAFALLILPLELDCGLVDIEPGGEVADDVLGEFGDVGDVGDVVDGPVCVPGAVGDRGAPGVSGAVGEVAEEGDEADDEGEDVDDEGEDVDEDVDDGAVDEDDVEGDAPADAPPPPPAPPAPPAPPPDCACAAAALAIASVTAITT